MKLPAARSPATILICGGLILTIAMGTRAGFGLFLRPMTLEHDWSRETFSFALALQNLTLGLSSPLIGLLADRIGAARVMLSGALLYVFGLCLMAHAQSGLELDVATGVFVGLGQACTTYSVVFGMLGRSFPAERRSLILGVASAAGSFGQFAMLPYSNALISRFGWFDALLILAATTALIVPLSLMLFQRGPAALHGRPAQSSVEALREAFSQRSYILLSLGYCVCGFQLAFITVHFPAYVADLGFSPEVGMSALALVGLFNIFGSYAAGALGQKYPKKYLLSGIYALRALAIALFVVIPESEGSILVFAAVMGLLWLATVPLTSGMIGQIFGTAYLSTLTGIAFLGHQLGSFLGVWLGGYLYDHTGSYGNVWLISIALGAVAALLNLPINEQSLSAGLRAPARAEPQAR